MSSQKHVVIIGNGISGVTTARYIRKLSSHKITIISSESEHFFSRPALMYIYMGHMGYENTKSYEDFFWKKNDINLVFDKVESIDFDKTSLSMANGQEINYDELVIAVGSKTNFFGWPGQDLRGVQGLVTLQDLEELERNTKDIKSAVVIGGGLIGVEMAEMLATRRIEVTMLVRESRYWNGILPNEEAELIGKHIESHGIRLLLESNLEEIQGDEHARVKAVKVKETGEVIDCQVVGIATGVSPNVSFLKDSGLDIERGIMVNERLQTNIPNVYAVGDCAQFRKPKPLHPSVEQLWYTGKMHGRVCAFNICDHDITYDRGHWYNSAKFFDVEYHTYGLMFSSTKENEETFFWSHPTKEMFFRITWDKESRAFIGINSFNHRMRHEVAEKWLIEKFTVDKVLENLGEGNFNPEFYEKPEALIINAFNQANGTKISLKAGRKKIFGLI